MQLICKLGKRIKLFYVGSIPNLSDSKSELLKADKMVNQSMRGAALFCDLGTTPDGLPVHSLQTLLADLATLARNTVVTALNPAHEFVVHTRPTKLQQKALDLLAINPATCTQ